jgi:aminoglycoside-2''-adenylyltransferase
MNSALERAVSVMENFQALWGIAGGWALDLFIGRESRSHGDIDIAVLRADQKHLRSRISGHLEKVVERQLVDWSSTEMLEPPVHEVHVSWPDGYHLEFLLNEQDRETGEWVFRRDARIRLPLAAAFVQGRVPYLAPEIVLLYKAKTPSAKDDADFRITLSHLASDQRSWLRHALDVTAPGHHWASILRQRPNDHCS